MNMERGFLLLSFLLLAHVTSGEANSWRQVLKNSGHSAFLSALESSGASTVVDVYWSRGNGLTFFAPNNNAFNALAPEVKAALANNPTSLRNRLLFHVTPKRLRHIILRNAPYGQRLSTLGSQPLYKVYGPLLEFGPSQALYGPQIVIPDVYVGPKISVQSINGVFETVFKKMVSEVGLVLGQAKTAKGYDSSVQFSDVEAILAKNGLTVFPRKFLDSQLWSYLETVSLSTGITLFVFQNDAFSHLPEESSILLKENPQRQIQLLLFHVVMESVSAETFLKGAEYKTLNGQPLSSKDLTDIKIVIPDLVSSPTISVHVLSSLLLPKSLITSAK